MTCSCGAPATCVADVSGFGLYVRTPVCARGCPVLRVSALSCDVVVNADEMPRVMASGACWCRLPRSQGHYVTWCPTHGERIPQSVG